MKKKRFLLAMLGLILIGLGGYLTNFPKLVIPAILCILLGWSIYYYQI